MATRTDVTRAPRPDSTPGTEDPAAPAPGADGAAAKADETADPDDPESPDSAAAPPPARRQFGLAVVVLAVVTGVLVGFAAAMLTLRPDAPPGETSAEAGFVRDMTAHHAQAVDMGTIAMNRATTVQVRNLGLDIALTQQYEIAMMQEWLRDWGLAPTGTEPPMAWMDEADTVVNGLMPGMASRDEMDALRDAEGIEADRLFLDLMITHHLGGIHMVDGVLERSDHPDVTRLAEAMKQVQADEIQVMINLRDSLDDSS